MSGRLIPLAEAASFAGGVSVRTLEREHRDGRLAIVRIRAKRFVAQAELDRYIAAQTITCRSESSEIAGKSESASAVASALSALYRPAQPEPTRSRSSIRSAARRSTLRLVADPTSR